MRAGYTNSSSNLAIAIATAIEAVIAIVIVSVALTVIVIVIVIMIALVTVTQILNRALVVTPHTGEQFICSFTEEADPDDKMEFMREIDLMKNVGVHRNIVNMLACCVRTDPPLLIMEYVAYGDLLKYLRQRRDRVSDDFLKMCVPRNQPNTRRHIQRMHKDTHIKFNKHESIISPPNSVHKYHIKYIFQVFPAVLFSNLLTTHARGSVVEVLTRPLSAAHNDFCVTPSVTHTMQNTYRDYPTLFEKCKGSFQSPR